MNLLAVAADLKDLPDPQLQSMAKGNDPNVPNYLVLSELARRKTLRDQSAGMAGQKPPTVADELTGGIAATPQMASGAPAEGGIASFAGGGMVEGARKRWEELGDATSTVLPWWKRRFSELNQVPATVDKAAAQVQEYHYGKQEPYGLAKDLQDREARQQQEKAAAIAAEKQRRMQANNAAGMDPTQFTDAPPAPSAEGAVAGMPKFNLEQAQQNYEYAVKHGMEDVAERIAQEIKAHTGKVPVPESNKEAHAQADMAGIPLPKRGRGRPRKAESMGLGSLPQSAGVAAPTAPAAIEAPPEQAPAQAPAAEPAMDMPSKPARPEFKSHKDFADEVGSADHYTTALNELDARKMNQKERMNQAMYMGIMNAGFGMAASKSPHLMQALGEGALVGSKTMMDQADRISADNERQENRRLDLLLGKDKAALERTKMAQDMANAHNRNLSDAYSTERKEYSDDLRFKQAMVQDENRFKRQQQAEETRARLQTQAEIFKAKLQDASLSARERLAAQSQLAMLDRQIRANESAEKRAAMRAEKEGSKPSAEERMVMRFQRPDEPFDQAFSRMHGAKNGAREDAKEPGQLRAAWSRLSPMEKKLFNNDMSLFVESGGVPPAAPGGAGWGIKRVN